MSTKVLFVRNVNDALRDALWWLRTAGVHETSRNGPVLVAPGPVLTEYARPLERVLFSPKRDANPFFHFVEALWMLGGRNDVTRLATFNQRMREFSDDGEHLHGAYGFRWREWFAFDQLDELVHHLREQPASRRAVLTMWSPNGDLVASEGVGGIHMKDVPCNTHCYFDLRGGALNMSVLCRSNDAVWGAYGANAVHFAFLMEYMAMRLSAPVGKLFQYSHNLHVYEARHDKAWQEAVRLEDRDPYETRTVEPFPLLQEGETPELWENDLQHFQRTGIGGDFTCAFFEHVAVPLLCAHLEYREGDLSETRRHIARCAAEDWRLACEEWLLRRLEKRGAA